MKINEIEAKLENRRIFGYKSDGNTVTAHRWKVFPLTGNLYLQEPKVDRYGQRYSHVAIFFPGVQIGLDVGLLTSWQLDQYSTEDVAVKLRSYATVEALSDAISAQMEIDGHIKDSHIAFVRQYDQEQANKMQAYKRDWTERRDRERQATIEERERLEKQEREEHERAVRKKLEKAEQVIVSCGYIKNEMIDGKPLFLHLFDKYGVKIAARTRGWVTEKLTDIMQCKDGSANISRRTTRKGEKVSNGFVTAYFELRNYLMAAQASHEEGEVGDCCTEEELNHLFGKEAS